MLHSFARVGQDLCRSWTETSCADLYIGVHSLKSRNNRVDDATRVCREEGCKQQPR